ncbi:hypothetical protein Bca4012_082494 [Brassica carinata]
MDAQQVNRAFPNLQAPTIRGHGMPLAVQPISQIPRFPPIWEDVSEEQAYWDGILEAERVYGVNGPHVTRPTNGALGLPICPNLRVTAPPTPMTVLIGEDEETSYTGSSDGLHETDNDNGLPSALPISENVFNISETLEQGMGENSAIIENGITAPVTQHVQVGPRTTNENNDSPSLDLTLGIGINTNNASEAIILIDDSESDVDGDSGGFRNTRSSPQGMVMQCISATCQWRVYAKKMNNVDKYEVRKAKLQHTCSIDDRVGYERQATHAVIGEVMRSRYVGNGGAPRPNEIIQVMLGDLNVNISYWKAWRSREIALEYAQGSSGASYKLLPDYLQRLALANPGTITEMETEFQAGFGYRFKYMFLALAASVNGFKHMRSVIIIDGTHLRGKYGGCLLTASSQDGNYQVFPLAIGVVDSENDKAWEWFFKMLLHFIPNTEGTVFVSDRHSSIYAGISKIYPQTQHCACILHLKRNIRTYFKNKHLSYIVGKAARVYRLPEFYSLFNQIEVMNASYAEYLRGIGFEHWARVHFTGNRYNVMTSNIAESWNSVLREAREYPIMGLVEYIRSKLMNWFSERRTITNNGGGRLTPRVVEVVAGNFEQSGGLLASKINGLEYQVRDKDGELFHVNLSTKRCSCNVFQTLLIPCPHAISAAIKAKVKVETLVSEVYSLECLVAAYKDDIYPVSKINTEEYQEDGAVDLEILPPATKRLPGRPRKSMILSTGEIKMKGPRRKHVCSRCKGSGHNRATCKVAI